jgi:hypothetical protein
MHIAVGDLRPGPLLLLDLIRCPAQRALLGLLHMSKHQVKHEFAVVVDGETYRCDRTVYGKRVLTQRVHVAGMGTEPDPVRYGAGGHPIESMLPIATLIAAKIIRSSRA